MWPASTGYRERVTWRPFHGCAEYRSLIVRLRDPIMNVLIGSAHDAHEAHIAHQIAECDTRAKNMAKMGFARCPMGRVKPRDFRAPTPRGPPPQRISPMGRTPDTFGRIRPAPKVARKLPRRPLTHFRNRPIEDRYRCARRKFWAWSQKRLPIQ